MKRLLAVFLLLSVTFSLFGCSNNMLDSSSNDDANVAESSPASSSNDDANTPASSPAGADAAANGSGVAELPSTPIGITEDNKDAKPSLITLSGTITDFSGPVGKGGFVPWYVEWFTIDIEKENGDPATIIGLHKTAYIFGDMLAIGMHVEAYLPNIQATFNIGGREVFVATAIIAGMPRDTVVEVNKFKHEGGIYTSYDGLVSFVVGDDTAVKHVDIEREQSQWQVLPDNTELVVAFRDEYAEYPVAARVVILDEFFPFAWGVTREEIPESQVNLQMADYVFPASCFKTLNIPIIVHGVELDSPPPIIPIGSGTVLLPFRSIFTDGGAGFGNYAFLTEDGVLSFGGGGGGSENSYWTLGRASVEGIAWDRRIDYPPIIVNGIIYVSLESLAGPTPFISAWRFDNRIEIYRSQYIYETWLEEVTSYYNDVTPDESFAKMPIMVNGKQIGNHHAFLHDGEFKTVAMVPLSPIIDALGSHISVQIDGDDALIRNARNGTVSRAWWVVPLVVDDEVYVNLELFTVDGFNAAVFDGRIWIIEQ